MMKICVLFSFTTFLWSSGIRATSLTSGMNNDRKNEESDQVPLFETVDYPAGFGGFYQTPTFGADLKRSVQHSTGRRQTGIIYGDGKPIGILQPYQESFRFMPIKEDKMYAFDGGRSSLDQQQEPYINLMYPLTRFARSSEEAAIKMAELEASNAEFLDKHYPSMLVDFKIHNKLHPMASKTMQNFKRSAETGEQQPQKREIAQSDQTAQPQKREVVTSTSDQSSNTKKKRESSSLTDAEFDALKSSVAKRESGEKAGITDALNGLWSDMGLIEDDLKDNNEKLVESRHAVAEDEDLEDGFDQKDKIEAPSELKRDSQIIPSSNVGGSVVIPNKEAEDSSKIAEQPEKKRYIDVSFITKEQDNKAQIAAAPASVASETLVIPNKRETEQKAEIQDSSKETKRAVVAAAEGPTTETYEQYEKRVAREIKNKIKELKEEVKRELGVIDEDKDEEDEDDSVGEAQRKKRNIVNTLLDEESHFIDPNQNLEDVQLHPHVRRRRRALSIETQPEPEVGSSRKIMSIRSTEDADEIDDDLTDGPNKEIMSRESLQDFQDIATKSAENHRVLKDSKELTSSETLDETEDSRGIRAVENLGSLDDSGKTQSMDSLGSIDVTGRRTRSLEPMNDLKSSKDENEYARKKETSLDPIARLYETERQIMESLAALRDSKEATNRMLKSLGALKCFDDIKTTIEPLERSLKSKEISKRKTTPIGDSAVFNIVTVGDLKDAHMRKTRSVADSDTRKRKTLSMDSMSTFDDPSMKDLSFEPMSEENQDAFGRANQFLANMETRLRKANSYSNARFNLDDVANNNYRWQMSRSPDFRKRSSRKYAPMSNAKRESSEGSDYESDSNNSNGDEDEIAADIARKQEESRKVSINNNKANEQFKGAEHKKATGFNKNFYYYYGANNGNSAPGSSMGVENEAGKRENPPTPNQRMASTYNYRSASYPGQFYKSSTNRLHNSRQSFMKNLGDEDLNVPMTFKRMARRSKRHSGKNFLIPSRNTANAIVTNLSSRNVTVPRYMWWRNYTVPFGKMARQNFTEKSGGDNGKNTTEVVEWRTKKQQGEFGALKSLDLEGKKKINGLMGTFRSQWYENNLPKSYLQHDMDVYKAMENRDNYSVNYNATPIFNANNSGRKMLFWFPETSTTKNSVAPNDVYEYQNDEYEDYVQTTREATLSVPTEKTTSSPTTTTRLPETTQLELTKETKKPETIIIPNENLPSVWLTRGKRDVQEDMVRDKRSSWFWPSFFQENDQGAVEEEDEATNFEKQEENGGKSAFSLNDDGEIETDFDEFDLENGGGAFDREKRQADFTPFLVENFRSRRYADAAGFEPKQLLTEISEDELFGTLPQSYAGELSRYKRVKRGMDNSGRISLK